MMTCIGRDLRVTLTPGKGFQIKNVVGLDKSKWNIRPNGDCVVEMSTLHLGQTRGATLTLKSKETTLSPKDCFASVRVDFTSGPSGVHSHSLEGADLSAVCREGETAVHMDALRMRAVES